jgi:hypothetical protein
MLPALRQRLNAWLATWSRPSAPPDRSLRPATVAVGAAIFAYVLWFRVNGISENFQLLGDQIRDWFFAVGKAGDLPLAGAPSMAGGRGLGPVYYWLLWISRVTIGPFVDNLPHAGGIGLSIFQSIADLALLAALWRRFENGPVSAAVILLIATSPVEAAITASVWNPQVAIAFTKITYALVLTDGGSPSRLRHLLSVACAWFAIQAHSSAWPAVLPAIAWMTLRPLGRRRFAATAWAAYDTISVIVILQVPFFLHNMIYGAARGGGPTRALGALQGLFEGNLPSKLSVSAVTLGRFVTATLFEPWPFSVMPVVFVMAAVVVIWRAWRTGVDWLIVTVAPLALAIVLYSPIRDKLDYWYVVLAPSTAIMMGCAVTALVTRPRTRTILGSVALAVLLLAQAGRYDCSRRLGRVPEYQALVKGSRQLIRAGLSPRAILTAFPLPPTTDNDFLFKIMGGHLDPRADFDAEIQPAGGIVCRPATK